MKIKCILTISVLFGFICFFISCGTIEQASVSRNDAYEYSKVAIKDYSVVGIISIRAVEPNYNRWSNTIDPINYRLMEEAKKLDADDIINIRIDWYNGVWIAATAIAIKYTQAVIIRN